MKKSLVLGFFDGVHKAHRAVINSALECSDDVTLITFKDSPAKYFGTDAKYILSRDNSIKKIKELGVKEVIELNFASIASMSAKNYLEYLINTYKPFSISTGFNHTFGAKKLGTPDFLKNNEKKYNYKYICVPPIQEENEIISSSLIKKFLSVGNIEKANLLLESNFILEGTVIHGAKIGRTIGFPTANINYPEEIVKIPFGVYQTIIKINNSSLNQFPSYKEKELMFSAIMNWGLKPTVNNTVEPVAEVHILGFEGDLYGKNIKIEIIKQIRTEKKFKNLDELKAQIQEDIKQCSKL